MEVYFSFALVSAAFNPSDKDFVPDRASINVLVIFVKFKISATDFGTTQASFPIISASG